MLMPSKKFILIGLAGLLLTGCVSFDEITKTISDSRTSAEGAMVRQNQMRKSGAVVRMSGAKLAGDEVQVKSASQLPPAFSRPFSYLSAHQPLSAILGEIGRRTGVVTAMQPSDSTTATVGTATVATAPGMPNFSGGPDVPIAVDWNGDLKGLLDYLATTTRMFWKYEDGRIYFFKTETRSFHVFLPAGKRTVRSSISLAGSGSSSSSSTGTVDVASNMEIDAYDAIIKSVQAIVSTAEGLQPTATSGGTTAGSKNVVVNPALGLITVTATPAILDRVASYVRSVNERFPQNVMIGVKVYNLTLNKGVNAGVSLRAAYQNVANNLGVTLTGAPNMTPLNGGTAGSLVVDALVGTNWTGSQLLLQAMEQIGNVQYVTSGQVIAANGQPSPLQVATEFNYVSSRTPPVITSTMFTPGTVTSTTRSVGFTANFLPLILGDNRIMLQYQINLSSLISLDTFGTGDGAIQIPKVATQSLQQQAFLKDGQSIVLLGFEQERAQADKVSGMSGISRNAGADRNLMVIVMEVYSGK
jgi:type IVB pilus formation R64 PilN family outer membrane protein